VFMRKLIYNIVSDDDIVIMTDPVSDIKKWIKTTDADKKTKSLFLSIVKDIEDYEYEYEYVNAPAAMGDTHKSSCSYMIKGFVFEYHHINGDGGIFSAEFTITHNEQKETLLAYSEFAEMAKRFGRKVKDNFQTGLLDEFIKLYPSKGADRDTYHHILGVLNAFTFGQVAMIESDKVALVGFDFE
jgi:hypothetical protein